MASEKKKKFKPKSLKEIRKFKKRIATYTSIGKKVSEIAGILNVTESTVRKYLRDEETQARVANLIEEYDTAAEKKYERLFDAATERMQSIIKNGSDDVATKNIEMVMKMRGKLLDKGSQNLLEQLAEAGGGMVMGGAAMLPGPAADNAMKFLEDSRED